MRVPRRWLATVALAGITSLFVAHRALAVSSTTQLSIGRVGLMPNQPAPFKLKDFKSVARGYDKLVFDFNAPKPDDPHAGTPSPKE